MQKTYLSRAVTRAMSLDHPVGDPFGGPAYGEKNDPISAIISISTMAGTYAAAGSFAAMTLMQGLTFAGAALSLVGNVTGSKTLSKIGMIAGIAGGVGMLAESVMGTTIGGTVGETFGFGQEAGSAARALAATPGPQAPVVDGQMIEMPTGPTADLTSPSASYAGGNINAPGGATAALNAPGGATAPLNAAPAGGFDMMGSTGNLAADASLVSNPGAPGTAAAAAGAKPGFTESLQAGNYWDATKAAGRNAMEFANKNPGAAMVLGQAAGGLADWLSGKTDAEIAMLEAQVGFADARALQIQEEIAREKRRRINLNEGYQNVNANIAVNPNATIPQPWQQPQPGLIAGNMPPRG